MSIATKPELKRLKTALTAKQAELLGGLRNHEGIVIEPAADNIDQIQFAGEREITIAKLNLESVLLGKVRAALSRLDAGEYGICVHCDREIGSKRLAAVPWARTVSSARRGRTRGSLKS